MSREYSKDKKINRRGWPPGPWDNEPDYYEWTTGAGYPAYTFRLDDGCWAGIIEAPTPTDSVMLMAFCHTIRDKTKGSHSPGMISKGKDGIKEWCYSMEHYQSPIPKDASRGPYRTLEQVKEFCEAAAKDIFETHKEGTYVNYFKH